MTNHSYYPMYPTPRIGLVQSVSLCTQLSNVGLVHRNQQMDRLPNGYLSSAIHKRHWVNNGPLIPNLKKNNYMGCG